MRWEMRNKKDRETFVKFSEWIRKVASCPDPSPNMELLQTLSVMVVFDWTANLPSSISEDQYNRHCKRLECIQSMIEPGRDEEELREAVKEADWYLRNYVWSRARIKCRAF